jgi:hypothetical protein
MAVDQSVRLIDGAGFLSSVGLLQVRTESEFGSVCGMNAAAASVACRQMGFEYGSISASPCRLYGGANVCGSSGTPVSMQSLRCDGGELDVGSCSWSLPDEACKTHDQDAVVYCGSVPASSLLADGALRLIGPDGAPSLDGVGRLEVFRSGVWVSVCAAGFAHGGAQVACRTMGFTGAASPASPPTCRNFRGQDFCGLAPPALSELTCDGSESCILSCAFEEGSAVFCAPGESVLVQCSGDGDAQGRPPKVAAPVGGVAPSVLKRTVNA